MNKAVIYARYSSAGQTEQSIEGQLRDCYAYAKSKDLNVIGEYIDRALSGKVDKRPDFQRMIKDSGKKLFDYVIVWQLDRFARNKYDSAIHKNTLKKNGVRVLSAKENIGDDPAGILMESVLEGMAEYFSAELRVKVVRGMNESFIKGQALGGTKVYGYDVVDKKFVVNEKEAEIIRHIFAEFARGVIIKDIKKWLDYKEIKNKQNRPFCYNQVMTIIKNRKYIGVYSFAGQEKDGVIPPIVDKNIFMKAQERVNKNKMKPASLKAREQYRLTHKAFCGFCHDSLIADSGTGNHGIIYRYYKCNNKKKAIKPCVLKQFNKDYLESIVVKAIDEVMTDEFITLAAKQVVAKCKQVNENLKLAQYEKDLADIEKQIENYLTAIGQGIFTKQTQSKMIELESKKADLENIIANEKLNIPIPLIEDEVVFWFTQFQNGDLSDDAFRTRLIDTFVNKVVVFNDKIYITLNVREQNNDKLTVKEIIADFENEQKNNSNPEKFELYHDGARERT